MCEYVCVCVCVNVWGVCACVLCFECVHMCSYGEERVKEEWVW